MMIMGRMARIDELDRNILNCLLQDCRQPLEKIAEHVGSSKSACHRRIKSLEDSGIIKAYVADVDLSQIGYAMLFVTQVRLDGQSEAQLREFEASIASIPEIQECYLMTGRADYFLKVSVKDVDEYERFHNKLASLESVSNVSSSLSLRHVKKVIHLT
jgi:DNA-binding Lrp family transcriptional regulator